MLIGAIFTFAARFPDVTFYRIWAQNVMARHNYVKVVIFF